MPSAIPSHSLPNNIPRNILAFRTITTILAGIQQERPFKFSMKDSEISPAQKDQLKISNALANLAVAEHDIVAVTTVLSPEELNVIACRNSDSNDESPSSSSPNGLFQYWKLFFTKNPRRDEERDDESENGPVVVDVKALTTKALAGLDGDEAKLRAHVESHR
jgi:hypothetical protein